MNSFDLQVLCALQEVRETKKVQPGGIPDGAILKQGRFLFGDDWGGKVRLVGISEWSPRISMSLGMLKKAGYVEASPFAGESYSLWSPTEQGTVLAISMGGTSKLASLATP